MRSPKCEERSARQARNRPKSRGTAIDFAGVNAAAVAHLGPVLRCLVPGGKVIASEYVALNPRRSDNRPGSFKVRFIGPRVGAWADFATGDCGGDVVSLCAYLSGVSQSEAARRLARMLGVEAGERHHG
jgi:hypothetical protein